MEPQEFAKLLATLRKLNTGTLLALRDDPKYQVPQHTIDGIAVVLEERHWTPVE